MVGTTPRSPLCRHGFQRGSRLLPNSRGLERRSSFLIAVCFSGRWRSNTMRSVRMWSNREIISHVQDSLRDTHVDVPHPDSPITRALGRTLACVPTWADGASGLFAHTLGQLSDMRWTPRGRQEPVDVVAFMVADRHIVATMKLLPQNFYRDRMGRYKAFQHIRIFIFE